MTDATKRMAIKWAKGRDVLQGPLYPIHQQWVRADLYDALKAENERLRYVLGVIHEATATGDGLTPDECIDVHLRARAAFEGDG